VAEAAAKVAGVVKVVTFDDAAFEHALPRMSRRPSRT
jgi:hypothetical protein